MNSEKAKHRPRLEFVSVVAHGIAATAEVFTRGFSDYLVTIAASEASLLQAARSDSVDLAASRVVLREGRAVGVALVARRGRTCRLAGMSLVPEARRQGIGRALVTHVLSEAKARDDRAMVLEVIEQNPPAVRLYEGCGFVRVRRLVGFAATADANDCGFRIADCGVETLDSRAETIAEVDPGAVAMAVTRYGLGDLPWQISGETLAQLTPPAVGYQRDGAWVAVTNITAAQPEIRALVVEGAKQRQGRGVALLRALMARHPGKEWRVRALWPEELAGVFLRAGFVRTPLSQWQMARPF